jgi:hypothetical protein
VAKVIDFHQNCQGLIPGDAYMIHAGEISSNAGVFSKYFSFPMATEGKKLPDALFIIPAFAHTYSFNFLYMFV